MKILLVGEYSGFHNSLKEGLVKLGHEVVIAGLGDSFKKFPVDIDLEPTLAKSFFGNIIRQGIVRLTKFDIASFETMLKIRKHSEQLKNYDVVQLVNEYPLKTDRKIEKRLLQFIFKNNKNVFLSACGDDHVYISFLKKQTLPYSVLSPFFQNEKLKEYFKYSLAYLSQSHIKLHKFVFKNIKGIICGDMDYKIAYDASGIAADFVPFPINIDKLQQQEKIEVSEPIVIFHGINRVNFFKKGNAYFEAALEKIKQKYGERVQVITAESLPYHEYVNSYNKAHILLDQAYAYDQGYNALEAMAKGKVVFSGAETQFLEHYNLKEDEVCINALPDANYLVEKLSLLIENPQQIEQIGKNAKQFVEREHHYVRIAAKYLKVWEARL